MGNATKYNQLNSNLETQTMKIIVLFSILGMLLNYFSVKYIFEASFNFFNILFSEEIVQIDTGYLHMKTDK